MRRVNLKGWSCRCERCGKKWIALGPKPPKRCAGCKAPDFSKPARTYTRKH